MSYRQRISNLLQDIIKENGITPVIEDVGLLGQELSLILQLSLAIGYNLNIPDSSYENRIKQAYKELAEATGTLDTGNKNTSLLGFQVFYMKNILNNLGISFTEISGSYLNIKTHLLEAWKQHSVSYSEPLNKALNTLI